VSAESDRLHHALAGEFIVRLGGAMAVAGESVDRVRTRLLAVSRAFDLDDVEIAVFPTMMLIETGHGASAQVHLSSQTGRSLRLDQVAELYEVLRDAEEGKLGAVEGIERLDRVEAKPSGLPWGVRFLGHGILALGLALLFQPSLDGLIAGGLLGLLVGLLKLPHLPSLDLVFPVVAAFMVAAIVLQLSGSLDDPLGAAIPALITLLPGGVLTTGTVELAAGQMLSGAGRLVYGGMQLMLLAFGILAAAALLNAGASDLIYTKETGFGWWAPWLGVLLLAIGYFMHYAAPVRTMPFIALTLILAYVGQTFGATVFDPQLSGFFGALAMTPVVLWLDATNHGPPSLVTFLPGFWLLVPGAGGLLGVTELVGSNQQLGLQTFVSAIVTIMSIALGVLIGSAAYRAVATSVQKVSQTVPVPRWLDVPVPRGDQPRRMG
jgi:uncharacterized membrane protein YjjP (DUF1212 family)